MSDKVNFIPKKVKIIEKNNDDSFRFVILEVGTEYHTDIDHPSNRGGKFPLRAQVVKERIIGQVETPKRAIEIAEEAIEKRRKEKADGLGKVIWEVDI